MSSLKTRVKKLAFDRGNPNMTPADHLMWDMLDEIDKLKHQGSLAPVIELLINKQTELTSLIVEALGIINRGNFSETQQEKWKNAVNKVLITTKENK